MIFYNLAVELSEGYFGDDDDHSFDEDYEPAILTVELIPFTGCAIASPVSSICDHQISN